MNTFKNVTISLVSVSILLLFSSCKNLTGDEGDLVETLDPVEEVSAISGAESSTITVNRGPDSYFVLGFTNVQSNSVITEGMVGDGWCIDWQKPIDSDNNTYNNIPLYSTFNVESWNPVNFLLNIKEDLMNADSKLTFREIQVAIWSLRGYPEFKLNEVSVSNLPPRMKTNGEPNFSYEKVETILQIVDAGYKEFNFVEGTKYAVIAETPSDVQTVITVVQ